MEAVDDSRRSGYLRSHHALMAATAVRTVIYISQPRIPQQQGVSYAVYFHQQAEIINRYVRIGLPVIPQVPCSASRVGWR